MRKGIVATMALMMSAHVIPAQSPLDSWENLRQLHAGQKIEVVDMKLRPVQGDFISYSETAVSLRVGRDEVSIPRAQVLSVKNRQRSHRGRNALLGLAVGTAGGLATGAIRGATYHEEGETGVFMLVFTPIGAAIGAGAGAALPVGPVTIYRASAVAR